MGKNRANSTTETMKTLMLSHGLAGIKTVKSQQLFL